MGEIAADRTAEDALRRLLGLPPKDRSPAGARSLVASHPRERPWGSLRTQTGLETLTDWIYRTYAGAAQHPVGQLADLIGLSDFAGTVARFEHPPVLTMGVAAPGGSKPAPGGLYSRVDRVAAALPERGVHPNKLASLLKSGASSEEVAYRKVPELLASHGNQPVTRAALEAHLAAHPAPVPGVKTLGGAAWSPELERAWSNNEFGPGGGARPSTPDQWVTASERLSRVAQQWQRNGDNRQADRYFRLSEEAMSMAEGVEHATGSTAGQPKYASYQLPGGEQYRETLLTLPTQKEPANVELQQAFTRANEELNAFRRVDPDAELEGLAHPEYRRLVMARNRLGEQLTAAENAHVAQQFASGHFDAPNILAHTRSNERTLPTGERGRFLEEVQSDWHQQGKQKGYERALPPLKAEDIDMRLVPSSDPGASHRASYWESYDRRTGEMITRHPGDYPEDYARGEALRAGPRSSGGVPDAPFKESWPDLALKQQLLDAARDPNLHWLGVTSGQTQAARYDLSKQIDSVQWVDWPAAGKDHGLLVATKDGEQVIKETIPRTKLADYIGKEPADKLLAAAQEPMTGRRQLSGVDLQVGGAGMRHFYDALLPKRLEKIVKPFGGRVERVPLTEKQQKLVAQNEWYHETGRISEAEYLKRKRELQPDEEGWIVRLTPEMKARIVKEGLPLMMLPLAALARPQASHAQPEAH